VSLNRKYTRALTFQIVSPGNDARRATRGGGGEAGLRAGAGDEGVTASWETLTGEAILSPTVLRDQVKKKKAAAQAPILKSPLSSIK
jgi:hypothetical protein